MSLESKLGSLHIDFLKYIFHYMYYVHYIKLVLNIKSKVSLEVPQCGNRIITWLVRELDQEIIRNYSFKTVAAKEVGKTSSIS